MYIHDIQTHCDPPIFDKACGENRPSRASRTVREDVGASPLPGRGSSSFSESSSRSLEVEECDWSSGSRSFRFSESFLLSWKWSGWSWCPAAASCWRSPSSICPRDTAMVGCGGAAWTARVYFVNPHVQKYRYCTQCTHVHTYTCECVGGTRIYGSTRK